MSDLRAKEAEYLARIRAGRASVEIDAVVQWLKTLELQAIDALIDCTVDEHADRAARVKVFKLLQHRITAPTFEESQAKYKRLNDV